MDTLKKQARIAGALYTLVAITAPISLVYVPTKLFVSGNATATAEHLRPSEPLLRLGIGCELFHQAVEVFLVLALYRLFKAVNKPLARQLAILGLIPIPIVFINVLNEVAAVILAGNTPFLTAFDRAQLDALAMLFVRLHGQGIQIAAIYWGLWLFPFGLLVMRCGFIPRVLGGLLLIAGLGYLLDSFATLVVPSYVNAIDAIASIMEIGELPIILWLLIWGARTPSSPTPLGSPAT